MTKMYQTMNDGLRTFVEFLLEELQDLYHAERQLITALPGLARRAAAPELREALKRHCQETHAQVQRLERVFHLLGEQAKGKRCEAMEFFLRAAAELSTVGDSTAVNDAALLCAAQKAGEYQIASYGYLYTCAQFLGLPDVAALLAHSLEEESHAEHTLADIAKHKSPAVARATVAA